MQNGATMTRWNRRRTIVVTVLLAVAVACGGVVAWWRSTAPVRTELDKALAQAGWRAGFDVTDLVARHLPCKFNEATTAIQHLGFRKGRTYSPCPPPHIDDGKRCWRRRGWNYFYDKHDAKLAISFRRTIPARFGGGQTVLAVLFLTHNDSMKVTARLLPAPKF